MLYNKYYITISVDDIKEGSKLKGAMLTQKFLLTNYNP